jgi:regulator of replication initiation timing
VSDTPRTDAVEAVCLFVGVGDIDGAVDELVEHARTLERENAQLREALNLSETHRKRTPDCICPACKEIKARLEAK